MRRFEPSGHPLRIAPRNNGNRAYQYYLDGLNVKGKRIPLKKRPIHPNKKVSRNRSPEVTFPNQGELRRAAKLFSLPAYLPSGNESGFFGLQIAIVPGPTSRASLSSAGAERDTADSQNASRLWTITRVVRVFIISSAWRFFS
jgi:hypothetical protein